MNRVPVRVQYTWLLLILGVFNAFAGIAMLWLARHDFTFSAGIQFAAWGVINGLIALPGLFKRVVDEHAEAIKIVRLLRFSRKLNWMWLSIGLVLLAVGAVLRSATLLGHGAGVCIQAAQLMVFDRSFERALRA